jgi:1-acyl-sn-glycerol-3-phosphate acyltransferase
LFACRGSQGKARTIRKRTSAMLRALGATVQVHGDATLGVPVEGPPRGALMVTNHLSFLDSVVLYALWPIRSVAKREVSRWPVHGTLARAARTIFIDRDQARALSKVVSVMGDALRDGSLISAFPQGGIRCCLRHGGFRPAMFQAAVDGGVPVRPVAIRYRLADGTSTMWPAYIDETLIAMMARTARLRGLVIEVHVMPEIASDAGVSRRELSVLAEAAVVNALTGAVTRQPSPLHS